MAAGRDRHLDLEFPEAVQEHAGKGIDGIVGGHRVALGQARWLLGGQPMPDSAANVRRRIAADGSSAVFIAVDGRLAGALVMVDPVRAETPEALRTLREAGIKRIVLLSGDRKTSPNKLARRSAWMPSSLSTRLNRRSRQCETSAAAL